MENNPINIIIRIFHVYYWQLAPFTEGRHAYYYKSQVQKLCSMTSSKVWEVIGFSVHQFLLCLSHLVSSITAKKSLDNAMITQLTWHGTWCSNQINENATNQAKQSHHPYHISVYPFKGLIRSDKRCFFSVRVCNKVLMITAITIILSYRINIKSSHRLAINCHLIFVIKWQDYYLSLRRQTRRGTLNCPQEEVKAEE